MTHEYMDKIFWQNIGESKNAGKVIGKKAPNFSKLCWSINDSANQSQTNNSKGKKSFFSAEEMEAFRQIEIRKGVARAIKLDETGKVMTKEEEEIDEKVRQMLVKVGLAPSDQELAMEAKKREVPEIKLKSPYNPNRQRVKYFQRPDIVTKKVDTFRQLVRRRSVTQETEILEMLGQMKDDIPIDQTFLSESEHSDDDSEDRDSFQTD